MCCNYGESSSARSIQFSFFVENAALYQEIVRRSQGHLGNIFTLIHQVAKGPNSSGLKLKIVGLLPLHQLVLHDLKKCEVAVVAYCRSTHDWCSRRGNPKFWVQTSGVLLFRAVLHFIQYSHSLYMFAAACFLMYSFVPAFFNLFYNPTLFRGYLAKLLNGYIR